MGSNVDRAMFSARNDKNNRCFYMNISTYNGEGLYIGRNDKFQMLGINPTDDVTVWNSVLGVSSNYGDVNGRTY